MRRVTLAVFSLLIGGVGCGERLVDVRYTALNEEEECRETIVVQRPAEYWVHDVPCGDFSPPFVDPEGRCVYVANDCGPELSYSGDPYFSSCDTLPGCCDQTFGEPRCE